MHGITGELQILMETDGDLCSPSMLQGSTIHKPASCNSLTDDGRALYPATPPQNIMGKRCELFLITVLLFQYLVSLI